MTETQNKRLPAKKRREKMMHMLIHASLPLTGSTLAETLHVSRQVIVQDIALLKAQQCPIIATAQGYLFLRESSTSKTTRLIDCVHNVVETEHELTLIVDQDVSIINVTVEHPLYGEITGSLMIRTREDVQHFMKRLTSSGASLLSSLTGGVHLHLLEAASSEQIDRAVAALQAAGYLLDARQK